MGLPSGFQFGGIACGIKCSGKRDLAIISTDQPGVVAGVYTQNIVRATSIDWNRERTPSRSFRAVVINSGNANACTGQQGIDDNRAMAESVAEKISASSDEVLVLSTGVIGIPLPMPTIEQGIQDIVTTLTQTQEGFDKAAEAILTTDKSTKTVHCSVGETGDVKIAGMAKGAGMIGPNMATMLAVMMTDACLSQENAQSVLEIAANHSFNRISVEGHTSTNDALLLICSGKSGVQIESDSELARFTESLTSSCIDLARRIPSDGEGASHLISINVSGAQSESDADKIARTIAASALVKTAITGADPNWGRIVSAAGYAGVEMSLNETDLKLNGTTVFQSGQPVPFDQGAVSKSISAQFESSIELKVGSGPGSATHWTSDLTVEYVRFNSEYTT